MDQFEKITATYLYCDNCREAVPVRESLLLILPDGNMYNYCCTTCGKSLGTRREINKGEDSNGRDRDSRNK